MAASTSSKGACWWAIASTVSSRIRAMVAAALASGSRRMRSGSVFTNIPTVPAVPGVRPASAVPSTNSRWPECTARTRAMAARSTPNGAAPLAAASAATSGAPVVSRIVRTSPAWSGDSGSARSKGSSSSGARSRWRAAMRSTASARAARASGAAASIAWSR